MYLKQENAGICPSVRGLEYLLDCGCNTVRSWALAYIREMHECDSNNYQEDVRYACEFCNCSAAAWQQPTNKFRYSLVNAKKHSFEIHLWVSLKKIVIYHRTWMLCDQFAELSLDMTARPLRRQVVIPNLKDPDKARASAGGGRGGGGSSFVPLNELNA